MNNTLIIVGKTNSGKSTIAKALEELGLVERVITYTTRPIRPGEEDGVDYHFLYQAEFDRRRKAGFFAETADYQASFGPCSYGSAKDSYESGKAIVLNPIGVKAVLDAEVPCTILYLDIKDDLIRERAKLRGDDVAEINRRIMTDNRDFAGMELISDYIYRITPNTKVEDTVEFIKTHILKA